MYKDDYATISGTVTVLKSDDPGNRYNQNSFNLSYPTGYNKNNCKVVSIQQRKTNSEKKIFNFGAEVVGVSSSYVLGAFPRKNSFRY